MSTNRQMLFPILATVLTLLGVGTGQARADVVLYNTFGPGGTFDPNPFNGYVVDGNPEYNAVAASFSPIQTAGLSRVSLAVSSPSDPAFEVLLAADGGGQPGAILEDLGAIIIANPGFTPPAVYTLNSTTHPELTVGSLYWLILQPQDPTVSGAVFWQFSDPQVVGLVAQRGSPSDPWGSRVDTQPAFEVFGFVPVAAVPSTPEPSSFALLALGGVALAGWRRWKKRSVTA